jgi:hypothetical protein
MAARDPEGTHDGLVVEPLDDRPMPKRRRRFRADIAAQPDTLPEDWRTLLIRWLRRGGRSRWETLAKDAGAAGLQSSQSLLDWLLRHGWATVEEERRHGAWWPLWVTLREIPRLHATLGLPDKNLETLRWDTLRAQLHAGSGQAFEQALASLDDMPSTRATARGELLAALGRWREEQRCGTRRDFALFARGTTKAISDTEWRWLEDNLDLADFSIERHTPLLLVSASLAIITATGRIELGATPDFAALTPQTLRAALSAEPHIARWRVIENRTSFERLARTREADIGVLWLPGFPPTWWREAVAHLLALAPAPAEIACDPDPAGIEIALQAGALWETPGLAWTPWRMDASELAALSARSALSPHDWERLDALSQATLPQALSELAAWMLTHGEKAEQEGFL